MYSLKVLAISKSWGRILSFSARVSLERILTLSENVSFTIFQKPLLYVLLLMSRLPKRRPSLTSQKYYFRNKVEK